MDETIFAVSPEKWVEVNLFNIALMETRGKLKKLASATSLKGKSEKEKDCYALY